MQKITPFLWFDHQAEEAANFYVSVFKNAKMGRVVRYGDAGPGPKGSVMTASFRLDGGGTRGPERRDALHVDARHLLRGELHDSGRGGPLLGLALGRRYRVAVRMAHRQFGVTWQVVPTALPAMRQDADPDRAWRVAEAMMKMVKLDVNVLQRAYDGR